jgi:hypothetical protein
MASTILAPALDQFGFPTAKEVAAALCSGYYTGGLMDFEPADTGQWKETVVQSRNKPHEL